MLQKKYGCEVVRTEVGEINIVEEIIKLNAIIGSEGNGGIIYLKVNLWRDSLCVIALILKLLKLILIVSMSTSELIKKIPRYFMTKTKISLSSDKIMTVLNYFRKKFFDHDCNLEDGLRVVLPVGWIHLRPSNTEPIIRIMVETILPNLTSQFITQIFNEIKTIV
jgi:phosphomannomutase